MILKALLFFFVAVCNPDDPFACASENYTSERWPGDGSYTDYDVLGPYFTVEDCEAAKKFIPYQYTGEGEGMMKMNPWSDQGESQCFAREVSILLH